MVSSTAAFAIATTSLLLHTSSANLFDHLKQPRIIGGSTASFNRYPYTVALTTSGSNFFCGGTLIASDAVLTAAHCLRGADVVYRVAVNRADLTSKDGEVILVAKEIRHPSYSWTTDQNDIALLVLDQPVSVVSEEDIVRINSDASFPSAGEVARTMGWGDTDPDATELSVSYSLLEVDLPVISNEECSAAKGTDNGYTDSYESYIFDSMLCTFEPGSDACQGDSGTYIMFANLHPSGSMIISNFLYPQNKYNQQRKGGPLIIPGSKAAEDVLVGVTSWGIGCATKVFPGVFSRVSYAYDWIAETVCSESSNAPRYLCETPEPTLKPTEKPISAAPTPEATHGTANHSKSNTDTIRSTDGFADHCISIISSLQESNRITFIQPYNLANCISQYINCTFTQFIIQSIKFAGTKLLPIFHSIYTSITNTKSIPEQSTISTAFNITIRFRCTNVISYDISYILTIHDISTNH
ncbi:hypothetical protein ACHAXN_003769 [Cyclotella atomus]